MDIDKPVGKEDKKWKQFVPRVLSCHTLTVSWSKFEQGI